MGSREVAERRPVTVWVDHLGLAAFARLLALAARRRIERVRYLTVSPALGPLVRGVARFEGLDAFEYASHRAGRMNVYEAVHISAWELLDGLKRDLGVNPLLRDAVERYGLNAEKLRHHLLSLCFLQALRVIELVTISRAAGAADANVFLVRRSAALPALKSRFADAEIVSYLAPFARLGFRPRERNALDVYAAGGYFAGAALSFLGMAKFVLNWGLRAVFARGVPTPGPGGEDSANVAVHFCQTSHGRDDLTDLYWWFDSGIDPSAVTAFVSDPENEALIAALERDGFRVLVRPLTARRLAGTRDRRLPAPPRGVHRALPAAWSEAPVPAPRRRFGENDQVSGRRNTRRALGRGSLQH
jgi:hypothetical protein